MGMAYDKVNPMIDIPQITLNRIEEKSDGTINSAERKQDNQTNRRGIKMERIKNFVSEWNPFLSKSLRSLPPTNLNDQDTPLSVEQYLDELLTAIHDFVYMRSSPKRYNDASAISDEARSLPWITLAAATGLDPHNFDVCQQIELIHSLQKALIKVQSTTSKNRPAMKWNWPLAMK